MRLNFAGNSLVFGHMNRENTPGTFVINLAKQKTSKIRLNLTTNSPVFGRMRHELFSVNLAGREVSKSV